jgi:hypothetical protein
MTRLFMGFSMNDEEGSIDTVQADSKRYQIKPLVHDQAEPSYGNQKTVPTFRRLSDKKE